MAPPHLGYDDKAMKLAFAAVAAVQIVFAANSARAASGVVNTRFDSGVAWFLDKPQADAPVYAGFHGTLNADGRIYRRLHFLAAGSIDSYSYGADQTRSELFVVRGGPMVMPVDFDGGTGFIEATAGYARLHGRDCFAVASGLGYMAQYGRLGIGLFSRYQQVMVPAGFGRDIKALVFGVSAGVVLLHPYRPAPPSIEPPPDADGDGVEDAKDKCPGSRRGARVGADGCEVKVVDVVAPEEPSAKPEAKATASGDSAKMLASSEAAAAVAATVPPAPPSNDEDQDGVPNEQDQCPGTTPGFPVDIFTGCPVLRPRFALPQVKFVSLTAKPKQESYAQLDQLVLLLRDRPGVRLKITAYVDNTKDMPARVLKRVAAQRAQVLLELLTARGISPKRLRAVGADKPDLDEIEVVVSGSTKVVKPKGRNLLAGKATPSPPASPDPVAPPPVLPIAPPPAPEAVTPPPAKQPATPPDAGAAAASP